MLKYKRWIALTITDLFASYEKQNDTIHCMVIRIWFQSHILFNLSKGQDTP